MSSGIFLTKGENIPEIMILDDAGVAKRWRTMGGGGAYFAKRLDEQLVTRGGIFKNDEERVGQNIG